MTECNDQTLQEMQDAATEVRMQFGLFHDDSLLIKSLHNTLSSDQFARYDAMARERRELRHRINVLNAVITLSQGIRLREEQRKETHHTDDARNKVIAEAEPIRFASSLIAARSPPPRETERLFDQDQWDTVSQQLAAYQRLEPLLRRTGLLPIECDEADSAVK